MSSPPLNCRTGQTPFFGTHWGNRIEPQPREKVLKKPVCIEVS